MPDGYSGEDIDAGWWAEQIGAGIKYRARYTYENSWPTWRQYYRGEWAAGVMPKNVFFPMLRSVVPRVYFRNPQVSIRPAIPGYINMAFAQIMHRLMNKLIPQAKLKQQMKQVVHDTFLTGSGFIKLGYGALHTPSPTASYEEAPTGKKNEFFEYDPNILPGMPWAKRTHTGTVVMPDGTYRMDEARWIANLIRRPKDDLLRDPRFEKNVQGIVGTSYRGEPGSDTPDVSNTIEMVDLFEVRDRKFRKVFVFAPTGGAKFPGSAQGGKQLLMQNDDPLQERGFPFKQVVFNDDDLVCWGLPHAQILEPQQLEANEIRTQTMHHRRAALIKLLVKINAMTTDEKAKLLSADPTAIVEVDGNPDNVAKVLQTSYIPNDLIQAESLNSQDVRETLGFSRNEFGEFQSRRGDTSAEEARNVHASSEIRVDDMRDSMADLLEEVVREWMEIIFDFWTEDQLIDVVGPGGVPIWVNINPRELRSGRYIVHIDPDSAASMTAIDRETLAINRYTLLKDNPLADPQLLTRYMINEMTGVELDDILRSAPAPGAGGTPELGAGGSPERPTSPLGLAGMLQGALGSAG